MGRRLLPHARALSDLALAKLAAALAAPAGAPPTAAERAALFAEISAAARARRLGGMRPVALALLARSLVAARVDERALLAELGGAARGNLSRRFSNPALANLAWAIATARSNGGDNAFPHGRELLVELVAALDGRLAASPRALDKLGARDAAQLVWALGAEELLPAGELQATLLGAVLESPAEAGAAPADARRACGLFRLDVSRAA
jgi:hypothetical protein